jgi:hypothetical protein
MNSWKKDDKKLNLFTYYFFWGYFLIEIRATLFPKANVIRNLYRLQKDKTYLLIESIRFNSAGVGDQDLISNKRNNEILPGPIVEIGVAIVGLVWNLSKR